MSPGVPGGTEVGGGPVTKKPKCARQQDPNRESQCGVPRDLEGTCEQLREEEQLSIKKLTEVLGNRRQECL